MTAYFQEVYNGELTEIEITENQSAYSLDLVPGTYQAFAWVQDFQLGGAYTAYVLCGYSEQCTDHALQPFEVVAGQEITNIDICDWPLQANQLPLPQSISHNAPNLEGVTFSLNEGPTFRIGANGLVTNIYSGLGMVISPNRSHGLHLLDNDLFVINLYTGEQYNLTNTPNITEMLYQWPLDERIFYTALLDGDFGGPGMTGGLYSIHPNGSNNTSIDVETNTGNFALSPNGRFIAYGAGPTTFIYDLELNQRGIFDPGTFGLSSTTLSSIFSPAWSPNNQKLAWIAQGDFNAQATFAIIVFDLLTNTYETIHPYQIFGMDGFLPPAQFSPDGNWVAFQAFDQDSERNGVWIASVGDPNQTTEYFLGSYSASPVWSPDGRWLAFQQYIEREQTQRVFLFDLFTQNTLLPVEIPPNASVIDW
jgi:Tol biopolymer transport system component